MAVIGLDIGGTKMECVVLENLENLEESEREGEEGHVTYRLPGRSAGRSAGRSPGGAEKTAAILARERTPTGRDQGYQAVLAHLTQLIQQTLQKAKSKINDIESVGIGLPGSVDPQEQKMINGNTRIFVHQDLVGDLQKNLSLGCAFFVENDANCFAFAETVAGAGQVYRQQQGRSLKDEDILAVGLILGTGVGGGVVSGGRLLTGRHGGGAELGHTLLRSNGHPCYCGREGCAEQYLSGPALEALFASRISSRLERSSAEEIFSLAEREEPLAKAVVKNYQRYLVEYLVNLCNIFDPDFFVLGGGISQQSVIYDGLEDLVARQTFVPGARPTLYRHQLGDSAGVLGAALLGELRG